MNGTKNIKVLPLESIIGRVLKMLPKDSISEDDLLEWAYEAYEEFAPHEVYQHEVEYKKVINNKANVPEGAYVLNMILYNIGMVSDSNNRTYPTSSTTKDIKTETEIIGGETTKTTISKLIVTENKLNLNIDKDKPVYESEDGTIKKSQLYKYIKPNAVNTWAPLPVSSNVFHNEILLGPGTASDIAYHCNHAFSVYNGCIVTTFETGLLAIAYSGLPKDDQDRYIIPDKEPVKKAIESYLFSQYWKQRWYLNTEGAERKHKSALAEYEILSTKATGELMMPDFVDYQNLRNLNKFVKEDSPFSTMMGALNGQEQLHFKSSRDLYGNHRYPYTGFIH